MLRSPEHRAFLHKLRLVDEDRQNVHEIYAADDSVPATPADEPLSFINGNEGTLIEFLIDLVLN